MGRGRNLGFVLIVFGVEPAGNEVIEYKNRSELYNSLKKRGAVLHRDAVKAGQGYLEFIGGTTGLVIQGRIRQPIQTVTLFDYMR